MAQDNNAVLAKNTIMLYMRMIVVMVLQLYLSRLILNMLGASDFGIYNVVAGLVVMFSFLNNSMSASYQRYFTFNLGIGDYKKLQSLFSIALTIQLLLSIVVIILSETVGLWIVNTQMNFPADRIFATNCVYQFSIIVCVLQIMAIPFNASIISHEKMDILAYLTIGNVVLKFLLIVFSLYINIDKLILFAIVILLITLVDLFLNFFYCRQFFNECQICILFNKKEIKEIGSFAGWNVFSDIIYVLNNQGVNVILNIYFGPIVNAARGIGTQVLSAIHSFIYSFQTASVPQITKTYATNDITRLHHLLTVTSKVSFFLLLLVFIPLYLETNFVLQLWLKNVPDYTVTFVKLILITKLADVMAGSLVHANRATGNIKFFQIVMSSTSILCLLLSVAFVLLGFSAEWVYIAMLITAVLAQVARIIIVLPMIRMKYVDYLKDVIIRSFVVFSISFIPTLFLNDSMDDGLYRLLLTTVLSSFLVVITSYMIGLNKNEKIIVNNMALKLKNKISL